MGSNTTAILTLCVSLLLSGCALSPQAALDAIEREGAALDFRPARLGTAPVLAAMLRTRGTGGTLWVMIEGDGRAWLGMHEPSRDPTPVDAAGWRLARAITAGKVLYLARPCQFLMAQSPHRADHCTVQSWTGERFADHWVAQMDSAIDEALRMAGASRVILAGYSGGGTMAALIALRRKDVEALITLGAPLDHRAWTHHHGVTPLEGSLNPSDAQQRLAELPQLHITGLRDETVPPVLIERYVAAYAAIAPDAPAAILRLDADHTMQVTIDLARLPIPLKKSTGRAPTTGGPHTLP